MTPHAVPRGVGKARGGPRGASGSGVRSPEYRPLGGKRGPCRPNVARSLQDNRAHTDPAGGEYRPAGEMRDRFRGPRTGSCGIVGRANSGKILQNGDFGAARLAGSGTRENTDRTGKRCRPPRGTIPTPGGKIADPAGKEYRSRRERLPTPRGENTDPTGGEYRPRRETGAKKDLQNEGFCLRESLSLYVCSWLMLCYVNREG